MTEFRYDSLRGRWVAIAPSRASRPTDLTPETAGDECPFCPGHESRTTPEVFAVGPADRRPDEPGWRIRVFPNRYPVAGPVRRPARDDRHGLSRLDAIGRHEVLVETPEHDAVLERYPDDVLEAVIRAVRTRLVDHEASADHAYAYWYRNVGPTAGQSLAHPHSQLLALPFLPDLVRRRIDLAVTHHRARGRSAASEMLDREFELGERIVTKNRAFVALTPYGSAYPYEMAIHPLRDSARFVDLTDDDIAPLASILRDTVARLRAVLGNMDYNIVLNTAPNHLAPDAVRSIGSPAEIAAAIRWSLEITPRVPRIDGFEWSVGLLVNPVTPEAAARELGGARITGPAAGNAGAAR